MTSPRVASLDQFRGYNVAGMILVNYLGAFALTPPVLKHPNTFFSYADTIMPAFLFASGFALRLALLRRVAREGVRSTYARVVARCLGLVLLSTVLECASAGPRFKNWAEFQATGWWPALAGPLKCEFWETLAVIGVTSLWVLPVIAAGVRARVVFLLASLGFHLLLAQLGYFHFVYARPNALDRFWGATDVRGLDGGPLGFLAWSFPQLVGSFAYDTVAAGRVGRAAFRLATWSALLMALGYGLSCLSLSYPRTEPPTGDEAEVRVSESPVVPCFAVDRPPEGLLAYPPFVRPPASEQREMSYWLMTKRAVSLPFNLFATGFCLAVYASFALLCDRAGWRLGLFQTFGQNALAAYVLHELVGNAVGSFAPPDSPWWWVTVTLAAYASVTYLFVRRLEKAGIYLRL